MFWNIMQCRLKQRRRLGGTYRLLLQGRRVSSVGNHNEAGKKICFEDGCDVFLQDLS
jgi:hypothetical protein